MRWNDDLLAGFDLSQKSKVKEVKEKSKEKREKIPGTDFIPIYSIFNRVATYMLCINNTRGDLMIRNFIGRRPLSVRGHLGSIKGGPFCCSHDSCQRYSRNNV